MKLSLTILLALRDIGARMMPERMLLNQVRVSQPGEVTAQQLKDEMKLLEAEGSVLGFANQDTGTRWKITDTGKARLAEAGL